MVVTIKVKNNVFTYMLTISFDFSLFSSDSHNGPNFHMFVIFVYIVNQTKHELFCQLFQSCVIPIAWPSFSMHWLPYSPIPKNYAFLGFTNSLSAFRINTKQVCVVIKKHTQKKQQNGKPNCIHTGILIDFQKPTVNGCPGHYLICLPLYFLIHGNVLLCPFPKSLNWPLGCFRRSISEGFSFIVWWLGFSNHPGSNWPTWNFRKHAQAQ